MTANRSIWVLNTKGGVGKTTLALFLANAYRVAGVPLRMIDCDGKRKLAAFMANTRPPSEVVSLDIGATSDDLRADPSLAVSYWDDLATFILSAEAASLVDLGANVDRHILQWARSSRVGEVFAEGGVEMDIFVPITAEPLAVEAGIEILKEISEVFPAARRVLVLNQVGGKFDAYAASTHMVELETMKKAGEISVALMPRCVSEGWVDYERLRLPFERIIEMTAEDITRTTGMGRLKAVRSIGDVGKWLQVMHTNFGPFIPTQA